MSKKALIITYYWSPAGGSGVQRWLYFVKYLREFGIEPIVFTVENPQYPIEDKSLEKHIPEDIEIIRQKIWEPTQKGKSAKVSSGFLPEKPTFSQRIKNYIRANYFFPDAKMFWINPSVKKLEKYLKNNPVDWLISTGPPHTTHIIAKKLKVKTGIPWLADFRDPWTDIDYLHHFPLTQKSLNKHKKLEQSVLQQADIVTVVSPSMQEKYKLHNEETYVITNGYDEIDIEKIPQLDTAFTITHIGLLNADRNPIKFWEVLAELVKYNEELEYALIINLVGAVADEVKEKIRALNLERFVNYTQYVPSHAATYMQLKSQILLLLVNQVPSAKSIVTGKVFEYLRAHRPILAMAPVDGDLAQIIYETNSGKVVDFNNKESLKELILSYFEQYQKGKLNVDSRNIEQYHRKNLTAQLVKILNKP
jgi:glycosyltransferase involved in cell wall biosynthesis